MGYTYLEHAADVGILVEAETLEDLFRDGIRGLLSLFCLCKTVSHKNVFICCIEEETIEYAFVALLNEVISLMGVEESLFADCQTVEVRKKKSSDSDEEMYCVMVQLVGEKIDLNKHEVRTEVKAVTYSGLSYSFDSSIHRITCLCDV